METKANYVLIGAFTIVVSLFLLLFALWAAKYSSEKSWQEYMVVFNEPVTGLSEGSSVQYNGISVGTVQKLSLAPDDPRRVRALLRLQARAPVKTDTRAKMSMTGITGSPIIQLTGREQRRPAQGHGGGARREQACRRCRAVRTMADVGGGGIVHSGSNSFGASRPSR